MDGNLLNDTFHTYSWDLYGKLSTIDSSTCGTNGTCLTYDAFGRVVEKNLNGNVKEILYSPVGKTAVLSGQTIVSAYLPLPGGATEFEASTSNHTFWHKDWLGSVRLASTVVARNVVEDRAYAPFGESYNSIASGQLSFTGDTQDLVAGTFDTPNRELNPNQGRWISPDPAGLAAVDPTNPQSFNRYAYVGNNPLGFVDPSGLDGVKVYKPPLDAGAFANWLWEVATNATTFQADVWTFSNNNGVVGTYLVPVDQAMQSLTWAPMGDGWQFLGSGWFQFFNLGILNAGIADPQQPSSNDGGNTDPNKRNPKPSKAQCAGQAFLQNAVSFGLDAAGFIPGEGLVNTLIDVGLSITGTVNSAVDADVTGSLSGIASLHLSALEPLGGAIPVIGIFWNGIGTANDVYKAYQQYQTCVRGQGGKG